MEASKSLNQLSIQNYFGGALKSELYAYANSTENQVQLRCYDWETPSLRRALIRTRTTSDDNGDYGAIDMHLFGNNNSTIKAQVSLFNTAGGEGTVLIRATNRIQFGTNNNYNYIGSDNICYWFNGVDYGKSIVTYAASGWGMHSIAFGWSGSALWAKVDQTQFKIYG